MKSSLKFTLIQTDLIWEDKKANLQMLEEKIALVKEKNTIVILPEMFTTGFSMKPELLAEKMNGFTMEWLKRLSATHKNIITGTIIIEEDGKYFNRLIWMQPDGKYAYYNKRHLFAYGEEDKYYTPGNKKLITSVNGFKINLQVCYDLRFPVWSRQEKNDLYDVLIYTANWPEKRIQAWEKLLQARAIENQCYVIGVNRIGLDGKNIYHSGNSMIVNSMGEVLYNKKNDEDTFTIELKKKHLEETRDKLPFWKDADECFIKL